ncbi:MAG: hypothetical protein ACBR12_00055 [Microcoleus sp.]
MSIISIANMMAKPLLHWGFNAQGGICWRSPQKQNADNVAAQGERDWCQC